jgi:hypothetical protein
MSKSTPLLFLVSLISTLLLGCSSGSASSSESEDTGIKSSESVIVTAGTRQVYLPKEFESEAAGDSITRYNYSGDADIRSIEPRVMPAGVAQRDVSVFSKNGVSGFIAVRDAEASETDAASVISNLESKISAPPASVTNGSVLGGNITTQSQLSTRQFGSADIVLAEYEMTLANDTAVTEMANALTEVAVDLDGTLSTVLSLPAVQGDDATSTEMSLKLLVLHLGTDGVLINAVMVPKDQASTFASAVSTAVNPTNTVRSGATLVETSDNFAVQAGSDKADFLFVVDDSGSMSDEQNALSQAAQDFVAVINNSGFDYSIGVITTGYDSDLVQDDVNFPKLLTPADGADGLTELENRLVAGTGGSATETGIFNAEQTLTSGGDAANEGMPRANSSLSVVLLSDEDSQYERRSPDGVSFDVTSNLFVTNGYTFHSIVDPFEAPYSQYDDLSNETGGLVADIENLSSFEQFMTDIADAAGAISSQFELSQEPVTTSIVVTNNGTTVPRSLSNGWSINEGAKRIVFHGTELPAEGDEILVTYRYAD